MDAEKHLKSVEFKLLGLTHLLAVGYGASRKKKRSEINQTGTHCCELGCLNVTLLIPVPKVQEK